MAKPPAARSEDTKDASTETFESVAEDSGAQTSELSKPAKSVSAQRLAVEEFEIWQEERGDSLKFQFTLKNIDPQHGKVKGYTFVVLKPEKGSQEPFRVSPWASLEDGRPALFKKGQYFSIARFKFVSGTFLGVERAEPFKTATVYVYSETGDLMLEQVYHVDKILRA